MFLNDFTFDIDIAIEYISCSNFTPLSCSNRTGTADL